MKLADQKWIHLFGNNKQILDEPRNAENLKIKALVFVAVPCCVATKTNSLKVTF